MKIILTGGGTGGHTFPLIAVARQIKKYSLNEIDFLYVGPKDAFERSAGKWKGTIDAETLIKNIYADRLISRRSEITL